MVSLEFRPRSDERSVSAAVQEGQVRQVHNDGSRLTSEARTCHRGATREIQLSGDLQHAGVLAMLDEDADRWLRDARIVRCDVVFREPKHVTIGARGARRRRLAMSPTGEPPYGHGGTKLRTEHVEPPGGVNTQPGFGATRSRAHRSRISPYAEPH